jgi:hypothetical protein
MTAFTVGYFVGSLARESINRKLANALVRLAPADLPMREIPIGELPLYSCDYDADYPPNGARVEGRDRRSRCRPFRNTRVQPLDPGCVEERNRLGQPSLGRELVRS